MPKVGKKHFKYTKEGRAKAKKHAKKTGLEIEYMGGGVVNRKYYASGGAVYGAARKRKPKGRLTIDDIKRALGQSKAQNKAKGGTIKKPDDSWIDPSLWLGPGLGPALKKARKRKPKGRLSIDDIGRALGASKAQNR